MQLEEEKTNTTKNKKFFLRKIGRSAALSLR
jgi:hypothetical protein